MTQSLAALAAASKAAKAAGFRKGGGGHKRRIPKPTVGGAEGVFQGFVTRPHPSKRHRPAAPPPLTVEPPVVPTLISDPQHLHLLVQARLRPSPRDRMTLLAPAPCKRVRPPASPPPVLKTARRPAPLRCVRVPRSAASSSASAATTRRGPLRARRCRS